MFLSLHVKKYPLNLNKLLLLLLLLLSSSSSSLYTVWYSIFALKRFTLALNDDFFVLPIPRSGFLNDPDQPSPQIVGTAKRNDYSIIFWIVTLCRYIPNFLGNVCLNFQGNELSGNTHSSHQEAKMGAKVAGMS